MERLNDKNILRKAIVIEIQGNVYTAGVDEAGRGPLAGPVIAAAVILNSENPIDGLADSKILTEKKREELFILIQERAIAWSVGRADVHEIDEINILHATMLAMKRALDGLKVIPGFALIDGNRSPKELSCNSKAIVQGDATEPAISAASIIAKVTRDREMCELHKQYPHYGFAQHKGYSTKLHLAALAQHGICPLHRRSFAPVAKYLVAEIA